MTRVRLAAPGLALALLLAPAAARAITDPSEALPDPREEARAVAIGKDLRCLVCQNESIEDSGADLARDLRHIVRQRVAAGDTNQQIVQWLVARYGNFVRLRPPFEPATLLLWLSPVLAVAVGVAAVLLGRRRRVPGPAPLNPAEQERVNRLIQT